MPIEDMVLWMDKIDWAWIILKLPVDSPDQSD